MYTTKELQEIVNNYISGIPFVQRPEGLYKPIEYVMLMGGKRVRPVLMLSAYNLFNEDIAQVLPPASAIEIFHNYTLLHDDLMDRADMRRGKKTVHKVWGDNTAILSGDAMYGLSYHYIAQTPSVYLKEVLDIFNLTTMEVFEGQQYDVDFELRNDVSVAEYLEMIRLKTAVLLAAALKIGAILGGASPEDAGLLYEFGINVGLIFQLKDDYLDVYGDPSVFGKKLGGDIVCNKKTYMLINALEKADEKQMKNLNFWLNKHNFETEEKIRVVTGLYDEIGIKGICEEKMTEYYNCAMNILDEVSVDEYRKKELKELVHNLMYREH